MRAPPLAGAGAGAGAGAASSLASGDAGGHGAYEVRVLHADAVGDPRSAERPTRLPVPARRVSPLRGGGGGGGGGGRDSGELMMAVDAEVDAHQQQRKGVAGSPARATATPLGRSPAADVGARTIKARSPGEARSSQFPLPDAVAEMDVARATRRMQLVELRRSGRVSSYGDADASAGAGATANASMLGTAVRSSSRGASRGMDGRRVTVSDVGELLGAKATRSAAASNASSALLGASVGHATGATRANGAQRSIARPGDLQDMTMRRSARDAAASGSLVLASLNIAELPADALDAVGDALTSIDLSANRFEEVPRQLLAHAQHLQRLYMYNNRIASLSAGVLGELRRLRVLSLSYNQLQRVPGALAQLDSLRVLHLNHNRLTDLPDSVIEHLRELEELDVSHNQIGSIGHGIGSLVCLRVIRARANALVHLPPVLGTLPLDIADFDENPLVMPPLEVVARGDVRSLCAFLRDHVPSEASAHYTRIEGAGARGAVAGELASFVVRARDTLDRPMCEGFQSVVARLVGPGSSSVQMAGEDKQDGSYAFAYSTKIAGEHALEVRLNGEVVGSGPLRVLVRPAPADVAFCTVEGEGVRVAVAHEPACVIVTLRDRFKNIVPADVDSRFLSVVWRASGRSVEGHVRTADDGVSIAAAYTPSEAGRSELSIRLAGKHLPGSPFVVLVDSGVAPPPREVHAVEARAEQSTRTLPKPFAVRAKARPLPEARPSPRKSMYQLADVTGSPASGGHASPQLGPARFVDDSALDDASSGDAELGGLTRELLALRDELLQQLAGAADKEVRTSAHEFVHPLAECSLQRARQPSAYAALVVRAAALLLNLHALRTWKDFASFVSSDKGKRLFEAIGTYDQAAWRIPLQLAHIMADLRRDTDNDSLDVTSPLGTLAAWVQRAYDVRVDCKKQHDAQQKDMCRNAFHKFDVDRDGLIDMDDLLRVFETFNIRVPHEDLATQFSDADRAHRGRIGFDEFVALPLLQPVLPILSRSRGQ